MPEGTAAEFTVRLSRAPASAVTVNVDVADAGGGSDFLALDEEGAKTVRVSAGQRSATLTVPTVGDQEEESSGAITATLRSGTGYTLGSPASASVTVTDAGAAGVMLSESSVTVDEEGGMGTYDVVLTTQPTGDVIVTPVISPTGVATVSGPLTFTSENWATPQSVTVTGVNDDLDNADDARQATITHTIAGGGYDNVVVADVRVTVRDDDGAGVQVTPTVLPVPKDGRTSYTVRLATQPTGDVTVTPAISPTGVATVSGPLTFTPGTWNRAQRVTVRATAGAMAGLTATIRHTVTGYGAVTMAAAVRVTLTEAAPEVQQWLARVGRTMGTHVTDAVSARLRAPAGPDSHVTVAGHRLPLGKRGAGEPGQALQSLQAGLASRLRQDPATSRGPNQPMVDLRQLLVGSSFRLNLGGGDADDARLTAWGGVSGMRFAGRDGGVELDGDVFTGTVGLDHEWDRVLAGIAVSHSWGNGESAATGQAKLKTALTSIQPYVRLRLTERLNVWGLLGYGWGEVTRDPAVGATQNTDTNLLLGAVGGRGILLDPADAWGFELATRTDLMFTRTMIDRGSGGLGSLSRAEADADAHRVRLLLEGTRPVTWTGGRTLTPTVQVGLRHDWGDAETGFGLEIGGRVRYADPGLGLTVEGAVRGLLAHEDSAYEEWGARGAVRLDPGTMGQGLALTLAPAWGATAGGAEGLWARQSMAGLASPPGQRRLPGGRLNAEVGYGLAVPATLGAGVVTPYAGTGLADGVARIYRVGTRLQVTGSGTTGLTLSLEGLQQDAAGTQPRNQGFRFQAAWGF